jgi:hypothetical protein
VLDLLRTERQQEVRSELRRLEAKPGAERLVAWVIGVMGQ